MTAPHILCIGQFDSISSTAIQADIQTAQLFGVHAYTAISGVVAQSAQNTHIVHDIPEDVFMAQIHSVMEAVSPRIIKIGRLGSSKIMKALGVFLDQGGHDTYQIVIDPAMSDSDHIEKDALDVMKRSMIVYADVLTLDLKDAAILSGTKIETIDEMRKAAEILLSLGPSMVVLRGDDLSLPSQDIFDVVADINAIEIVRHDRHAPATPYNAKAIVTLACGMASCLARGLSHRESYDKARAYLGRALETAPALDFENEPLRHFVGDVG